MSTLRPEARILAEAARRIPGAEAVISALDGLPPAFLVGGAVRDLLRGEDAVDLDIAIEGDARAAARVLAERLGGRAVEHERFGTATVAAPAATADLATTRRETYAAPGALPDVEPATLAEDLSRRDFTINAMALGLSGDDLGVLHDPYRGRDDLNDGVIRVLHERSFVDDPTRLLRALRYEARLGARLDPDSARLACEAIAAGAPATVSGARIGDELLDLLAEPNAAAALARMREVGLDAAIHPKLRADEARADAVTAAAARTGADPGLAQLAALVEPAPDELSQWLGTLHLTRDQRDRAMRAATQAGRIVSGLDGDPPPSAIHDLLSGEPPEALALALAIGAPAALVERYVDTLSGTTLEITGEDLLAAGVPQSPAVGYALLETLRRKLDGEVSGRDEELALALRFAREDR